MALVTWTDNLSVGVELIDNQHTVLFNTINDLHDAMMKAQGQAKVGELLGRLQAYTYNHFSAEEALMEDAKYAGLATHRIRHRKLTKQVEWFVARYQQGDLTLSLELANFLSNWLKNHIQSVDQSYRPWLNKCGVF
jgi:hemerythrin-like metal-binding protein